MKELYILLIEEKTENESKLESFFKNSSYKVFIEKVETLEELNTIYKTKEWLFVLSALRVNEHSYKDFLNYISEIDSTLPFILFTEDVKPNEFQILSEDFINDIITTDNLARLHIIISRELKEFESKSAKKMAEEAVYYMAYHDPLTGLANRYEFEKKLNTILDDIKRDPSLNYSLLYLDLDQFKVVNDTCGHQAGDDLLRQVSVVLLLTIKKRGFAARIGGDEFVIILNDSSISDSKYIATELLKKISEIRFVYNEKIFTIGGSIGLIQIKDSYTSISELMSLADIACYSAKETGRNRVHISDPQDRLGTARIEEMKWLTKLNFSLENNQFTLFKQPIVSLPYGGGSTVFFEFLLRLKSDHHTFVMPDVFMRAAERYNMMPLLDRWVINHAFNYISKHFANHDLEKNKICFFINLSGASLSDSSFFKYTYDKMKDYSIDPRLICFEITETVAISDFRKTLDFINEVRSKGSYFALDDFGSGMSSFAYLKNLTVDFVKIDGSFVRDMTIDSLDYAIVESIHKVAHAVGLKTIAEFVENMETLNHLNKIGVNYAQGYAISYPSAIE